MVSGQNCRQLEPNMYADISSFKYWVKMLNLYPDFSLQMNSIEKEWKNLNLGYVTDQYTLLIVKKKIKITKKKGIIM